MTAIFNEPGSVETALARKFEDWARSLIADRDKADVAADLGLAEVGVDALLWKRDWSLQRALRVLESLGALQAEGAQQVVDDVLVPGRG